MDNMKKVSSFYLTIPLTYENLQATSTQRTALLGVNYLLKSTKKALLQCQMPKHQSFYVSDKNLDCLNVKKSVKHSSVGLWL